MIIGSIVVHTDRPITPLEIPTLQGTRTTGNHVVGRHNGSWTEISDLPQTEIYLPQRFKHMTLTTTDLETRDQLVAKIEELDSLYPDARQLYKLQKLMDSCDNTFAAVVNIASAVQDQMPVSGSFYLLAKGIVLYVVLVFDIEENSVQLVWSTEDIMKIMQASHMFRYVIYPMHKLDQRPMFIHTQQICARWWKLMKTFGDNKHSMIRAANALEILLYKDPNLKGNMR